ncbi:MAG: diaminopimelate epimerase [Candidatus Omnitrophota bacterium]|nr:diaminopimelate epimerase [Candidatus Omnitrophota bacterium]
MNSLNFTKMTAAGNDFIIVDNREGKLESNIAPLSKLAKAVCERKRSIGANGLLALENSGKADVAMRIFNPDGGEVTMCGNGSRCMAYYVVQKGLAGNTHSIETKAGILKAEVEGNDVKIELTQPMDISCNFSLDLSDCRYKISFVNTGVPHIVHFVEDLDGIDIKKIGRDMRFHKEFAPDGANVNFVKITGKCELSIRTYERGVEEETLACGTGAVASSVIASELHAMEPPIKVKTPGGEVLIIRFKKINGEYKEVYLEGKVKLVYEGGTNYV